jgi:hypothetical protein
MLHYNLPARKLLLALGAATVFTTDNSSAATIYYGTQTSYSNTIDVGSSFVNLFDVAKFSIPEATLISVTVKVIQGTLTGAITVTNNGVVNAEMEQFESLLTARQFTSGLGYSQVNSNITDVVTSPAWQTATLQPGIAQTFIIESDQTFAVTDQSIGSEFWDAYTGTGNVTFSARNVHSVTVTGDNFILNSSDGKATTQFAVVYNYSIPEPTSALLGSLGALFLLRRRR